MTTEEIEAIVNNRNTLMSGDYYKEFYGSSKSSTGSDFIDKQESDFESSKLSEMSKYEAEYLNSQEQIGDGVNEIKKQNQ